MFCVVLGCESVWSLQDVLGEEALRLVVALLPKRVVTIALLDAEGGTLGGGEVWIGGGGTLSETTRHEDLLVTRLALQQILGRRSDVDGRGERDDRKESQEEGEKEGEGLLLHHRHCCCCLMFAVRRLVVLGE